MWIVEVVLLFSLFSSLFFGESSIVICIVSDCPQADRLVGLFADIRQCVFDLGLCRDHLHLISFFAFGSWCGSS